MNFSLSSHPPCSAVLYLYSFRSLLLAVISPKAAAEDGEREKEKEDDGDGDGEEGIAPLAPPQAQAVEETPASSSEADALSFEGSAEEVLRYTIVAKVMQRNVTQRNAT